ncbi:DUF2125 domain-containing protein [Gymnodinialimonas ceratoperidinii]|uniref:DUF2125 domain-containing protein n=1 Tax=Gymnodinialimonas ceratoperidinii TaxID=2856823 RepID=A0A8F6TV49_9RHOB|nr:DUF2125 domain-containing protein [Gymnodinialimonas ceratoperidinii]QXT39275.1 DUF2125 domain-containing protein [Gymnodinialimonas ceratoperidinii]
MKRFLIGILVVAALGVVAWGAGAMLTETAASRWMEERRSAGWVANASDISVSGFPMQFTTEFQGVELADPETGLAWTVESLQFEQDVFRLDRIAARWPAAQTIASPLERLTLSSIGAETHAMEAMLDVQPTNRFALDALDADTGPLRVSSSEGWEMQWDQGNLSVARVADTEATYDIATLTTGMVPPEAWRRRLDPANVLPEAMEQAEVRATATFDAPWDMDAIERARPQVTSIDIENLNMQWGDMLFRATGTLDVTPGGVPEGELSVRAENWRAMVELASNAGVMPERLRTTAEAMLQVLAGMTGSAENIDATLSFSNGRMFIGPLPIGPAPSLRIR